jgi:glyoxylase-like metal-dependent hydrolase (beta-lactamase superfamily II)
MATIPFEDNFNDILGKAQRGLKLNDAELAARAGISVADVERALAGKVDEEVLRKVAPALNLKPAALVASARQAWYPPPPQLAGLAQFNTPYHDMTVNAYVAWDPRTREAVVVDTGADCRLILDFVNAQKLTVKFILLTHTHGDHIADLAKLKAATGAPAFVSHLEPTAGAEPFAEGRTWAVGGLRLEARQTSGHSTGGMTFVISGLARPVAVVGDSLFAGSMGGGGVSYADALANNRQKILTLPDETVICPGHGPLTTVGEEKRHNPFFPEFPSSNL